MGSNRNIAAIIAYLIGMNNISEWYGENEDIIAALEADDNAVTIRSSMKIMTTIMKHYGEIDQRLKYSLMDRSCFDDVKSELTYLESKGYEIIPVNARVDSILVNVMKVIESTIDNCIKYFQKWVPWEWIKNIFLIPNYENEQAVICAIDIYRHKYECFPFGIWINLPCPEPQGNILRNDSTLLHVLAHQVGEEFNESWRCYQFVSNRNIEIHEDSVGIVDAENFDVYRLVKLLEAWKTKGLNSISRLYIITDPHINMSWQFLKEVLSETEVYYIETTRLGRGKSNVDNVLIQTMCKLVYKEKVKNFILFASDDDFVSAVKAIKEESVTISVVYEPGKVGVDTIDIYNSIGVEVINAYENVDSESIGFEEYVIKQAIIEHCGELRSTDISILASSIAQQTRLDEASVFEMVKRLIEAIRFKVCSDGGIEIYFEE